MAAPSGFDPSTIGRRQPIDVVLHPFRRFMRFEAAGGIMLLVATAIALVWANSPYAQSYLDLWHHTKFTIGLGGFELSKDLVHWINDLLMAVFFLVVGLEIKREMLVGELASPKRAAVPIIAAIGGMVVPGAIYALFNLGQPTFRGWGVPMATDIAFALGVLAILGRRVPLSLRVFLASLAIIDDLGALLVIAIFYTDEINMTALLIALALVVVLAGHNALGVRRAHPYALIGLLVWYALYESGVHSTIAGVLVAMTIPARTRINGQEFLDATRRRLDHFERAGDHDESVVTNVAQQADLTIIETLCQHVQTPLQRLEHSLVPWVSFLIVPIFALANAGVAFAGGGDHGEAGGDPAHSITAGLTGGVGLGIAAGLVLGKPLGIALATWLALRSGIGVLPPDISRRHFLGMACLGGIGFTMSLFIAQLAFINPNDLAAAKIAVLGASAIAGVIGFVILRTGAPAPEPANGSPSDR